MPLAFNRNFISFLGLAKKFCAQVAALAPWGTVPLGDCHLQPGCVTASVTGTPNATGTLESKLCLN